MAEKTINHYYFLKFSEAFWRLGGEARAGFFAGLARDLQADGSCANFYQVSGMSADADLLVWSAAPVENPRDEADFFERITRAMTPRRGLVQPAAALWGFTKPSVYSKGRSPQEIDPLAAQRATYLVLYPFVKTVGWYLLGKDTRQGMMNEHIRIGHQYPEIKQLLLYSFGVQDQEFVVVYEMENLFQFSELVNELRGSDVREYTQRDTPVYTGVWRSPEALGEIYGGKAVEL